MLGTGFYLGRIRSFCSIRRHTNRFQGGCASLCAAGRWGLAENWTRGSPGPEASVDGQGRLDTNVWPCAAPLRGRWGLGALWVSQGKQAVRTEGASGWRTFPASLHVPVRVSVCPIVLTGLLCSGSVESSSFPPRHGSPGGRWLPGPHLLGHHYTLHLAATLRGSGSQRPRQQSGSAPTRWDSSWPARLFSLPLSSGLASYRSTSRRLLLRGFQGPVLPIP